MKTKWIFCGLLTMAFVSILAFKKLPSYITGRVSPPDAARAVWAISGTDSVKGTFSAENFALSVKPGTYKVIIVAKDPYRDVVMKNLEAKDGETIDLGEIFLQ